MDSSTRYAQGVMNRAFARLGIRWRIQALRDRWARDAMKAAERRLRDSFGQVGSGLVFDDATTVTVRQPRLLEVGRDVGFNVGVFIHAGGGVHIGDDTRIGPYALIHSADHRFDALDVPVHAQGHTVERIEIGNDVWIGGHAVILRGAMIPDHCVVGAGARIDRRLARTLEAFDIVVGNPGVVVGNRARARSGAPETEG